MGKKVAFEWPTAERSHFVLWADPTLQAPAHLPIHCLNILTFASHYCQLLSTYLVEMSAEQQFRIRRTPKQGWYLCGTF